MQIPEDPIIQGESMLNHNLNVSKIKQIRFWVFVISLFIISIVGSTTIVSASDLDKMEQVTQIRTIDAKQIETNRVPRSQELNMANEAAKRWEIEKDVLVDATKLRVYNFDNSYLIISPEVEFESARFVTKRNGEITFDGNMLINPVSDAVTKNTPEIYSHSSPFSHLSNNRSSGGQWNEYAQSCYEVLYGTYGWMLTCYKLHRLFTSYGDFYQIEPYATAKQTSGSSRFLTNIRLQVEPHNNSAAWADWSPSADKDVGSCSTTTLAIGAGGAGIEHSYDICEKWDITLYPGTPGKFKNNWTYWWGVSNSERDVALMSVVKLPVNSSTAWTVGYGFTISVR